MADGVRTPDLHQMVTQLLREAKAALEAANRPVPQRCYVADGPDNAVPIDSEQLVAGAGGLVPYSAEPVHPGVQATGGWRATVYVDLARFAPSITDVDSPPTSEAIDRSARGLMADAVALARATQSFGASCRPLSDVSLTPVGPEGGLARWIMVASVPLL